MLASLDKNINCPHESQVTLDRIFEESISPLTSEDDYMAELPYITSSGLDQLEFIKHCDSNLIEFD